MRHAAAILVLTATLYSAAHAASFVGAQDGDYRASDGDTILIKSTEDLVGVKGLDCHRAVVSGGRLHSKECWGNGHLGEDVDVSWKVDRNVIIIDSKRYVLIPPLPPLTKQVAVDPFIGSADGWMHNQSQVRVDTKSGHITYSMPKPDLRGVVKAGAVLYRGNLKPGDPIFGQAYAFKDGCLPASYPVRGLYTRHNEMLTLTGPGPVRKGCEVVAYSYDSPHSKLVFEYTYGD